MKKGTIISLIGYTGLLLFFVALRVLNSNTEFLEVEPYEAWIQYAALGVSALGSIFQGLSQRSQARRLEANNPRPVYQPSIPLQQNQALAQQMARTGLPNQVYNNQLNQIQSGLATGFRQLGNRGNLSFNTNAILRNSNQAVANLNAADAQARMQWQGQLINANRALAEDQRYQFNVNQFQPYMMNSQNVASMRRAGSQNIFGGLGMAAQGAFLLGQPNKGLGMLGGSTNSLGGL